MEMEFLSNFILKSFLVNYFCIGLVGFLSASHEDESQRSEKTVNGKVPW